jgi:hypothetical protein
MRCACVSCGWIDRGSGDLSLAEPESGNGSSQGAAHVQGRGSKGASCADFFIAGAPRCGTTSLAAYLRGHPEVCFSSPKETHYFVAASLDERLRLDPRRHYIDRFFPHRDDGVHRLLGEGSVTYLYFPNVIEQIVEWNPEARFIVMLRNPLAMVPSFHARMLWVLEEDTEDFAEAWHLQAARARGERIPARCLLPSLLQYSEIGKLGKYVKGLLERVPRSQCHFIVYDDLVAAPGEVCEAVLAFLGLACDGRTDFDARAGNQGYRVRWLQRLLFKPPGSVLSFVGDSEVHRTRVFRAVKAVRQRLVAVNTRTDCPRPSLSAEMQAVLRDTFRSDSELLAQLIGRDLSHWYGQLVSEPEDAAGRYPLGAGSIRTAS